MVRHGAGGLLLAGKEEEAAPLRARRGRRRGMRYLSLFSGIEAASVAWEPLGWEPVAFCEVDAFPSAVLAHRWPHVPNLGDITKVDWSEYAKGKRKPDVVVGGSPCQSFSVAGRREGLAGESGLMFEYIRAVRCIRPRCFVWENVLGALTSEGGEAFRQLLSEMDALGYGLAWRVLDAQFFGVAQRRERVFLVGCLGDPRRACEILFERESLRWDTPSSRDKRKELAEAAGRGAPGEGGGVAGFCAGNSAKASTVGYAAEQSPTLRAGESGTNMVPTVLAYGIDHAVTTGGNCTANGPCAYEEVEAALKAGGAHSVAAPVCLGDDNAKAACDVDMCGTLKVYGSAPIMAKELRGAGGGNAPVAREAGAIGLNARSAGPLPQEEPLPTMTVGCGVGSALAFMDNNSTGARYTNFNDGTAANALAADFGAKQQNYVHSGYTVRRLTPVECERLQGFPDGHTDLTGADPDALFERMVRPDMDEAERKKLRTRLRKWCKACPDAPRYKACGNSMAVPVMRWIGERIRTAEGGAGC